MKDLERFVQAQAYNYEDALKEMKNGKKQSCWMWYVFPQVCGLGQSNMAKQYELEGLDEAREYLAHPVLGKRLLEICEAVIQIPSNNAQMVFGMPDNMKLQSSMTLFEQADPSQDMFGKILDKFFHGERDEHTLDILRKMKGLETLDGYRNRVYPFMKEAVMEGREIGTSDGLRKKVSSDGRFLPFVGDTLVFLLDDKTK